MAPIKIAANGSKSKSAEAPIITPPANVAFKRSSIPNLVKLALLQNEIKYAVKQLPVKARTVQTIALYCPLLNALGAELKEGQYIHKNIVPKNENTFDTKPPSAL
jgi:hypothetical protein